MAGVLVFDRSVLTARETCLRLRRRHGLKAAAVHPTDFDLTFDEGVLPSLIVTELNMEMFSGYELLRQVRSIYSSAELPILAYTTAEESSAWDEALNMGANSVVVRNRADTLGRFDIAVSDLLQTPQKAVHSVPTGLLRFFMPSRAAA